MRIFGVTGYNHAGVCSHSPAPLGFRSIGFSSSAIPVVDNWLAGSIHFSSFSVKPSRYGAPQLAQKRLIAGSPLSS